jgi:hypothetical protein
LDKNGFARILFGFSLQMQEALHQQTTIQKNQGEIRANPFLSNNPRSFFIQSLRLAGEAAAR